MKARVATMLSLTGVLVAGSAAALVNTQVLRGAAPASNTIQVLGKSSSSTSAEAADTTEPSSTTIVVSTSAAPEPELHAYQAQSSGIVTLDTAGDVLRIESAVPAAGWQVTSVRQVDSLNVLVTFQQGDNVVEFRANLLFDEITPSVSTYLASAGPNTSTATSTGGTSASTPGTTRTTADDGDDDSSKAPTTSDDSGKGRGGGGDDPSDDD